jgi:signal transduction histidine kinase
MIEPNFVHDMRNFLGIILGYATLLLDDMPADDPRRSDAEEVRKAGEGALALLENWDTAQEGTPRSATEVAPYR